MTDQAKPASPGFPRRLAAMCYDGLLLLSLWFVAAFAALPLTGGEAVSAGSWGFSLYLLILSFLFLAWFWTHGGQTLGMRAWRMRVEDQHGGNLSWKQAGIRFLVAILSCAACGLGFLWALWDKRHRTWHDMASGARVVLLPKNRA